MIFVKLGGVCWVEDLCVDFEGLNEQSCEIGVLINSYRIIN